jgi:hypothetical protein
MTHVTDECQRSETSCVRLSGHTHASDSRGDTLRRITKAALGSLAGCALVLGGTQLASGDSAVLEYSYDRAPLVDLRDGEPTAADPYVKTFDNAYGELRIKTTPTVVTSFKLRVDGIATSVVVDGITTSVVGRTFGAHLHTDPCDVVGTGGLGGPHYNHDFVLGTPPIEISPDTEGWLDLAPNANGVATVDISAPFVPDDSKLFPLFPLFNQTPGDMSIVIHEKATNPIGGGAGLRQACLDLSVPQWDSN